VNHAKPDLPFPVALTPESNWAHNVAAENTFAASEQAALTALLDDPSPAVRQALLLRFSRDSEASAALLRSLSRQANSSLADHASWFLRELDLANPVTEFRDFIRSLNYELESGAILLSRTVNPALDVGHVCSQLDVMAARCRELIAEPATTREKCRIMNRVLFHEYGLHANAENYTDPLNSFLDQVLIRRKGIPISLSIIYLLVAERVGLQLEPVGLPGHFLVGCYDESAPFFIDAYNAGLFLTADNVYSLIKKCPGAPPPSVVDLAPTPIREVLSRCCRNLVNHSSLAGQPAQAGLFESFVAEFVATYDRHAL